MREHGTDKRRVYYVYEHRDPDSHVFYIGKGSSRRSESRDRHIVWHEHVRRLNGKYTVHIVREGLTEDEALELEYELMRKYGFDLINWDSPFNRTLNISALDRQNEIRDRCAQVQSEAAALEKLAPERALTKYAEAKLLYDQWTAIKPSTGPALELLAAVQSTGVGPWVIVDRMTVLLKRLGRPEEARKLAQEHQDRHPSVTSIKGWQAVQRRTKLPAPEGY